MLMRFAPLLLLLAVLAVFAPLRAQSTYETYTGWAVPTDPVLPATDAYPRLWFGDDGLADIRAKWEDPAYAEIVERVRDDIQDYKRRNPSSTDPGDRSQMAKALAFAWIVDGDIVARVKGYEALLLAYQNVPREATVDNFSGETDEIYRATWLQNFCEAYDWFQPILTEEDDATIRAALAEETALLADNMVTGVRYAPRPHNHRSKPAYAVGTAALTLADDPRAGGWLRLALEQQNTTTRYQFSQDGVYREGSHYWLYTLVNGLPFLWHYRQSAGVDLFPAYQTTFEWPVRVRTGRGWMPALEDGFPKPAPTHMAAAAYRDAPTDLHSSAGLAEVLQWNWQATDFFTQDYTGATRDVVWSITEFLTADASIPASPPDASPTQRLASGQVAFRSDWNAGDPDTRMLLFHGVASADNHDHPDLMSYTLDAENTPLAVDAGYGPGGFSDDRRDWYTSARAHNILTVNGFPSRDFSLQRNEGPEQTAFVDGLVFDAAEMSAPNNGVAGGARVTRGVAFLDNEFFAVYDHVDAFQSASLQVHLHGRGLPERTDNQIAWTAPADRHGAGGTLHAAFVADGPLLFDEDDGWTSFYFSREETQRWVAARRNTDNATFLHTLAATGAEGTAPEVTDRTEGRLVSAELAVPETEERAGGAWHLASQQDHTLRTAGRITTDATFAGIGRTGDDATRWGLVRGTRLAWDGLDLISASTPATVSADHRFGPEQNFTFAPADASTDVTVQLLPASASPTGATLDGVPLTFESLGRGRVRFTLPPAGGTATIQTDIVVSTDPVAPRGDLALSASPNPSSGSVQIRLRPPGLVPVRVAVYDVLGRRVRVLADGLAVGKTLVWDGRTEGGTLAPNGVYIVSAESASQTARTRITLLR